MKCQFCSLEFGLTHEPARLREFSCPDCGAGYATDGKDVIAIRSVWPAERVRIGGLEVRPGYDETGDTRPVYTDVILAPGQDLEDAVRQRQPGLVRWSLL